MNVGLPGAGIGGIFYLLCALAMPDKEVFLTITRPRHKFRYRLVTRQLSIVIGIVSVVFFIYKLANNVFGFNLSLSASAGSTSIIFYSLKSPMGNP
jgi:Na+/H+ antiporter NhaD/arsenite permease-like protein